MMPEMTLEEWTVLAGNFRVWGSPKQWEQCAQSHRERRSCALGRCSVKVEQGRWWGGKGAEARGKVLHILKGGFTQKRKKRALKDFRQMCFSKVIWGPSWKRRDFTKAKWHSRYYLIWGPAWKWRDFPKAKWPSRY